MATPPQGPGIAEVAGLKLWYTVRGRGPVCLVPSPGWGCSSDLYQRTLARLCDGLTLVFLDSRGCGRSERPSTTSEYRFSNFASDLEGVRRALGEEKIWILGHSHGGVMAMRYAADYPARAAGLLLIGTNAESDADYEADVDRRKNLRAHEPWFKNVDWDGIQTAQELADGMRAALPLYFHDLAKMTAAQEALDASAYSIHPYHGWRDSEAFGVHELERLPLIKCPTLLVVGEDDFVCSPMHSRRIQGLVDGAEVSVIRRCGHFPWLEQPEPFYSAVEGFLDRHRSK
jgi:proline iminopeptidase